MKKATILYLICIAFLVNNCRDKGSGKSVRNLTINKSNSYSTLFMDSTAVESFIKEQKLNDTITSDMRAFYNARNFQFAWFSRDGLTEHAFIFRSLYDYSKKDENKRQLDYTLDNLMLNDSIRMMRATAISEEQNYYLPGGSLNFYGTSIQRTSAVKCY